MYLIRYQEGYQEDLEFLGAGLPTLEQQLWETLYLRLAQDPWAGVERQGTDRWSMRAWPIPGLRFIQAEYRIDDAQKIVERISLRAVNTSIL